MAQSEDASDVTQADNGSRKVLYAFCACGLFALFVYLLVIAEAILIPLAIAVFVVLLLDAIKAYACRLRFRGRKIISEGVGLVIAILFLLIAFVFLASMIKSNVEAVSAAVPQYVENINAKLDEILALTGMSELPSFEEMTGDFNLGRTLRSAVSTLASATGNTMTVLFYVIFILLEQVTFRGKIRAIFAKDDDKRRALEMMDRIGRDIQYYIGLKTLVSALTGFLSYIVMAVIGVDFAAFWAILIFILNFIPYIGSLAGVAFPAALTLVQFTSIMPFIVTTVVLASIQLAIGNILEPRLMGRSLNLSPLVILLSLAIFGQIWGIVGMVLSMPFMVIALIVCAGFESTRPIAILLSSRGRIDPTPR